MKHPLRIAVARLALVAHLSLVALLALPAIGQAQSEAQPEESPQTRSRRAASQRAAAQQAESQRPPPQSARQQAEPEQAEPQQAESQRPPPQSTRQQAEPQPSNELSIPSSQWTAEQVENPPRRELKTEVATKPRDIPLRPELVEQKFVAELLLVQPTLDGSSRMFRNSPQRYSSLPDELNSLRYVNNFILLDPGIYRGNSPIPKLSSSVTAWLKHVPPDRLTADERAFFESPAVDQGLLSFYTDPQAGGSFRSSSTQRGQAFYVFGRTEKECEARARTLLTILDYGFSRPIQQYLFTQQVNARQRLEKDLAGKKAAQEELAKVNQELTKYSDYSEDLLPGLRQQQMALEVDLAGTVARIEACNMLLAKPADKGGLSQERRGTVEDTKIQSEISLAGFQSRRAKLDEFVKIAKTKVELTAKRNDLSRQIDRLQQQISNSQTHFYELEAQLAFLAPIKVLDDTIIIHPVQWTTR